MQKKLLNQYFEWVESLKNSTNEKVLNELESLKELNEYEQQFVFRKCYCDMVRFTLSEQNDYPFEQLLVEALNFYSSGLLAAKYKYIFRVKVKRLEKFITREIAIPKSMSLGDLGVAIILAFNGDCSHLFQFTIDKRRYVVDPSESYFGEPEDMFKTNLYDIDWNPKKKYTFTYDFGDNYEFSVQFVKEVSDTGNYPIEVLKGKGYYCAPSTDGMIEEPGLTTSKTYACEWINSIVSESTVKKAVENVVKKSNAVELGGGRGGANEITLDEAACKKYSLTCGRW